MTGNPAISGADMKKRIVYIMTLRLGYELSLSRKLLLASAGLAVVGGSLLLDRTRSTDGKKVDRRDVHSSGETIVEKPGAVWRRRRDDTLERDFFHLSQGAAAYLFPYSDGMCSFRSELGSVLCPKVQWDREEVDQEKQSGRFQGPNA
jgi:hypothetical protein